MDRLELTDRGLLVFKSTQPVLQNRDEFIESGCNDVHDTTSTLGCYDSTNIYIYNSENSELAGLEESTAAHELLHAIWSRLVTLKLPFVMVPVLSSATALTLQSASITFAALSNIPEFDCLASPARIRLLCILAIEEMCVCELADMLMMSQPAISHHLRLLRQSGVVKYKKSGKRVTARDAWLHRQTYNI